VSESELYESVVKSIREFNFANYGLDEIEDTKEDRWAQEWIHALARNIDRDWGNYVDRV
jgi:tetrahydromethanopterin S-methyltransferase subunit G